MRRSALLAGLVLAAALAGCTALPGGDGGDGEQDLTVTPSDGLDLSFATSHDTIIEGEDSLVLETDLRNTGQSPARVHAAHLFGANTFLGCERQFPEVSWSEPIDLREVIRAADQAGGQTTLQWSGGACAAENIDAGLSPGERQDFTVGVEATYRYGTTVRADFEVVDQAEFDGSRSPVSTDNTAAPVHATVDLTGPVPIYDDRDRFSVPVSIRNVGDGEVEGDVRIEPEMQGPATWAFSCSSGAVQLFDGSAEISCTMLKGGGDITRSQVFLTFDLAYNYTERAQSTVTVEGN